MLMTKPDCPKYLISDKECVLRSQKGEYDTIRILYERYIGQVTYFIGSKVNEVEDVKDISSRVFIRVMENINALKKPDYFKKWLFTIVKNAIKNYYRSKHSQQNENNFNAQENCDICVENIPAKTDNPAQDGVSYVMNQLKPAERQILHWKIKLGLTNQEIGNMLGKSERAVEKQAERVNRKFRKLYLQKYKSPVYLRGEKNEKT